MNTRPTNRLVTLVLSGIVSLNLVQTALASDKFVNGNQIFANEGRVASRFLDEASLAREADAIIEALTGDASVFIGHGMPGASFTGNIDDLILEMPGEEKLLLSCWSGVSTNKPSEFSRCVAYKPSAAATLSRQNTGVSYIGMSGRVNTFQTKNPMTYRGMGGHVSSYGGQYGITVTRQGSMVGSQWIGTIWQNGKCIGTVSQADLQAMFDPSKVKFMNNPGRVNLRKQGPFNTLSGVRASRKLAKAPVPTTPILQQVKFKSPDGLGRTLAYGFGLDFLFAIPDALNGYSTAITSADMGHFQAAAEASLIAAYDAANIAPTGLGNVRDNHYFIQNNASAMSGGYDPARRATFNTKDNKWYVNGPSGLVEEGQGFDDFLIGLGRDFWKMSWFHVGLSM